MEMCGGSRNDPSCTCFSDFLLQPARIHTGFWRGPLILLISKTD